MKSNYRPIGEHIQLVDERNRDLRVNNLLGLSISKEFIPSVANTVGTNMSNYKVIRKNQFACSVMQVRRDKKMPVALLKEYDEAIISQAYPVFEVKDEQKLLPDYLMMWFERAEFDREACFHAVGGVRGSLDWEDFENMKLPIPHPDRQKEIITEYKTIENRIKLNERLIQKLEETAQAVYREWFVDFEFPDENGKPYKSSGGEMVFNTDLMKEIPKSWENKAISEVGTLKAGGDKPINFSSVKSNDFPIPIYSNGTTDDGLYGYTDKHNYPKNSITISARGTIGFCVLRREEFDAIVRLLVLIPHTSIAAIYLWQSIKQIDFDKSGSVQNQLTIPQISSIKIIYPELEILKKYDSLTSQFYQYSETLNKENQKLKKLKDLLLSKMTKI
ncbi:restriction endonuclease subunit S [Flagellimonas abyssi]|uniref:Restriction endonuclease subunit S n=1 Tax=Flagellimonas abyssi TaxID=2864871 RepID=A0ABS7EWP1_9FLAO|nr:restriction endonuclease subunit S [Allomuricauda abyssi]MBW8201172.1 restriction endonuclease subunit S [Allomuricauda abyssi]